MSLNIMIVAGEASGDLHGANLVRALQAHSQHLQFCGMGGRELSAAGVEILYDAARISVVGVVEVVAHFNDIIRAQRMLRSRMKNAPPVLLILIDLPDFNLLLAKKARKLGIPVFYYISPQVWAWRQGRVKTIKKLVDKVGVILPFEEDFFRQRGVEAVYVGHPLLDTVYATVSKVEFCRKNDIPADIRCVGLLPGSRRREVALLLPIFLEAAKKMQDNTGVKFVFLIPQALTISDRDFEEAGIARYQQDLNIKVIGEDRYNMMAACDAVIAASGTVTLELAILGVPMIVAYKLTPLSYRLGKLLIKLDHFSLVNLIAGYEAVPELLQDEVEPDRIAKELSTLVLQTRERERMKIALADVRKKLGERGASEKAAGLVMQMIEESAG
ncbi:MAG: lipid-A-disaccharide synthase [Desulforhopalus sp.]